MYRRDWIWSQEGCWQLGKAILCIHPRQPEVLTEVPMTSRLCWIGFREQRNAKKWEWFFEFDLVPAIGYFIMRAIGSGKHTHLLLAVWRRN